MNYIYSEVWSMIGSNEPKTKQLLNREEKKCNCLDSKQKSSSRKEKNGKKTLKPT